MIYKYNFKYLYYFELNNMLQNLKDNKTLRDLSSLRDKKENTEPNDLSDRKKDQMETLRLFAVEIAKESPHTYHQHGALIVKNGRVISTGFNDAKYHAEHNALRHVYHLLRFKRKGLQER